MRKVALVIGGSSGIGLSTVRELLDHNYLVYNASRRRCIEERAVSLIADVVNFETIKAAIDEILYKQSRIDVLVYSAGFSMAYPLDKVKEEDYRYLFEVNYFGIVKTLQYIIPFMKKQGRGRIVVISSLGAVIPIPYDSYYSSSKAAVNMLCCSLNLELEKDEIHITSLMPGGVRNHFTFKRKIYKESLVNSNFQKSITSLAKTEQTGNSNEQVARSVYRILKSKNPPLIVTCGVKNKIFYLVSKLIPTELLYLITKKKFGISK